jgi:glyoxylase-like metal-dependent hydrolase (beta-lactamase superfamily II)
VLAGRGGRVRIFVDEADPERLLPALESLADLPIERVLIPHGDPVLSAGARRIREAVAEARGA